ncbi:transglutaminase domain-containing protein [Solidesulfovibrio carbinoliphilus subsp. oakridgensis]|uniref:Transglutaminase domain-containing protein n=1 Tax=Solidesulfovibrio carbinoliphilus subsp. oakridgensis TaxID=694327 RepID=G7Q772_9BACT|nr:hypothetical protein [Solidesulfovibrio carbinoliphilus]EHJ49029.1 transglutaminase domain-containing protein [Solidesulfovibrio carbinoliphilus subsp. oakridgensis]
MPVLEDYLFSMEALPEEVVHGSGLAPLWLCASGTGTCGVTTAGDGIRLPLPTVSAAGSWRPIGVCPLPLPVAGAGTYGWHPAWGGIDLPALAALGLASLPLRVEAALTSLFALAGAGAGAGIGWPAMASLAGTGATGGASLPAWIGQATSDLDRRGGAWCGLPVLAAKGLDCSLASPVTAGLGSEAVVRLLCQGDPDMALAARALAGGAVGVADDDAVAGALLAGVAASLAYVEDGGAGVDVWTCALATYFRGSGDCEDGAILLHGLLLAAGLPADRLVTAFGRVGIDRVGHSWVAYRRLSDGRWTALDWTLGASQGPVSGLPVLGESAFFAVVDYALTTGAFFSVREDAAVFFARSEAEGVVLPRITVAAAGSLGARGGVSLAPGWLVCRAVTGAAGDCRWVRAGATGTAGSVVGAATVPVPDMLALAGAVGLAGMATPEVAGAGGGNGRAGLALPRAACSGAATVAALVAGRLALSRARAASTGLCGLLGGGVCRLPRPRAVATGLPGLTGVVGPDGMVLPVPSCLGHDGLGGQGTGQAAMAGCIAEGRGRAGGAGLGAYVFARASGEEWT